ncbi:hypothetical protein AB0M23_05345 [Streptomyces sp. NPDC052077]|uniref:hypothetical protein n=1 Tax=Streptomyces sp. NPDC052077 TaxID=3154757 RepID=UPI00341AB482
MRLFTSPSPRRSAASLRRPTAAALLAALATASVAAGPAGHAAAAPRTRAPADPAPLAPLPACAAAGDRGFPLTARLRGGPDGYRPGGGPAVWYLDLTNTTSRSCDGVHPVLVLVDERRVLTPSQPRLEFHDGAHAYPVAFRATDRDELIGPFDGEGPGSAGDGGSSGGGRADEPFPGFTVPSGRTVTVKLRLALAPGTLPNEVTATAAVVQRRGDDGEWIGRSNDYRFRVEGTEAAARDGDPIAPSVASTPDFPGAGLPFADELASTGTRRAGAALAAGALLVAAGAAAVLLARRRR